MQQEGLKLGDVLFLLSGCDSHVMNKLQADNNLALCHSEIEAFMTLLSGVVKDGKKDIITRKDRVNGWQLYGDDFPSGKLFRSLLQTKVLAVPL